MKTFNTISALGMLTMAVSAVPLERREGVQCNAKYRGKMYLTNLSTFASVQERGDKVGFQPNRAHALGINTDDLTGQVTFQFDECTVDGWNQDGREYGQLKTVGLGNYQCVTAANVQSGDEKGRNLAMDNCAANGDGNLDRQWFYANFQDGQGGPYVTVSLMGNPNDQDATYDLEAAYAYGGDGQVMGVNAVPQTPDEKFTMNLFDIEFVN